MDVRVNSVRNRMDNLNHAGIKRLLTQFGRGLAREDLAVRQEGTRGPFALGLSRRPFSGRAKMALAKPRAPCEKRWFLRSLRLIGSHVIGKNPAASE
jgi:hypothetical protein